MTTAPGPASFTIMGTLAYLALAVLGWGGFAAFFSPPGPNSSDDRSLRDVRCGAFQRREFEPGRA